jgi:hypothetical protein
MMWLFVAVTMGLGFGSAAHAKPFATSYLSVDVPDQWSCQSVKADWACRPQDKTLKRAAALIISAKEAGPETTLSSLEQQLRQPKSRVGKKGLAKTSRLLFIKQTVFNGQTWIEANHSDSEIDGFVTEYLATINQGLVVLVTLNYEATRHGPFRTISQQIRHSLRLIPRVAATPAAAPAVIPPAAAEKPDTPTSQAKNPQLIWLIVAFGAVIFLLALIRRK